MKLKQVMALVAKNWKPGAPIGEPGQPKSELIAGDCKNEIALPSEVNSNDYLPPHMHRWKENNMEQKALLKSTEGLSFPVLVIGQKSAWGNNRYLVRPIGGQGEKWVDSSRLEFETPKNELRPFKSLSAQEIYDTLTD